MPETATLAAPDTAAAPEAPLELAPPETAEESVPETGDAQSLPETQGDEEPDESRTYTAAEVAEREKVAAERVDGGWRKWQEQTQAKAKADAEKATYNANAQRANAVRQGFATNALSALAKQAIDSGRDVVDPQAVARVAAEINAAQLHDTHTTFGTHLWNSIQTEFPGYQPSAEVARYAQEAARAYDVPGMVLAQTHMIREAVEADSGAKTKARIEAEAAAAAAKKPVTAKPKGGGPTKVAGTGAGGGSWTNQREVDRAFSEGKATLADVKRARANLPW